MKLTYLKEDSNGDVSFLPLFFYATIFFIVGFSISIILFLNKKKFLSLIIGMSTLFISILGPFVIIYNYTHQPTEIIYELSMQTKSIDKYELIMPFFNNSVFANNLIVNGDVVCKYILSNQTNVINKSSNSGLNIIGRGNFSITFKATKSHYYLMSLVNISNHDDSYIWIFSKLNDNQNLSVIIDVKNINSWKGDHIWSNEHNSIYITNNGWQLYRITESVLYT